MNTRKAIGFWLLFFLISTSAFAKSTNPVANPEATVVLKNARFTVLTPQVIRMEWSPTGQFEDHATLVFVNRNLPVPAFQKSIRRGWLKLQTSRLTLFYKLDSGKFTKKNLRIQFKMNGQKKNWRPGMKNSGNLKGTTRTLDGYNGDIRIRTGKKIDLGQGLISRDGWVLIDDSNRPIFDHSDWPWVQPRPKNDEQDFYFFGYGYNYKAALRDFVQIAGRIPIPPRFAFGTWWSRYWEYTDKGLRELVNEFQDHRVPLDVLVVDIDWHIRFLPEWFKNGKLMRDQAGQSAGWTGFTWDRNYFPNPRDFLDWTKRENLKVCLNLHPAAGIQPHEAAYPKIARAMGINPKTKKYVPFDIVNKKFAQNFMNLVLHPLEKEGVDFWWLDWQQWSTTKIPGVNPTFYLNYVFFSDMARQGTKRPLIFHRYGGLGNHRYQIGFSGDTQISWKSLDFQPYFTTTAANVGFGYWSHDIGGHMRGESPPELYTRWIQWGAFSPIFRTHSTKSAKIERRIWAYPLKYYYPMRNAELLRHSLIPYIYSYARKTYETGISLCHPIYYEFPKRLEAYQFKDEYYFGDDLIVAPVTHPMGKDSLFTYQTLWLPPGKWVEWATGTALDGNRIVKRAFTLNEIPVYVRAGAILPQESPLQPAQKNVINPLTLAIFPGDSGRTVYYEDEGNTNGYRNGVLAKTPVHFTRTDTRALKLIVEPVEGSFPGMASERAYVFRFPNTLPPKSVRVNGQLLSHSRYDQAGHWTYNDSAFGVQIHTNKFPVNRKVIVEIRFPKNGGELLSGVKGKVNRLMKLTRFIAKRGNWDRSRYPKTIVVRPAQLGLILAQNPSNAQTEAENFPRTFEKIKTIVAEFSQGKPQLKPYLELLQNTNP